MLGLMSVPSLVVPASAEGLLVVGANIVIAPSSRYDGDKEWSAQTWVYNTGLEYGEGLEDYHFVKIFSLSRGRCATLRSTVPRTTMDAPLISGPPTR